MCGIHSTMHSGVLADSDWALIALPSWLTLGVLMKVLDGRLVLGVPSVYRRSSSVVAPVLLALSSSVPVRYISIALLFLISCHPIVPRYQYDNLYPLICMTARHIYWYFQLRRALIKWRAKLSVPVYKRELPYPMSHRRVPVEKYTHIAHQY